MSLFKSSGFVSKLSPERHTVKDNCAEMKTLLFLYIGTLSTQKTGWGTIIIQLFQSLQLSIYFNNKSQTILCLVWLKKNDFPKNISVWMITGLGWTEDLDLPSKRAKYEIWRGFGSDGYLYDFVSRNREARRYQSSQPNYGFYPLPLRPLTPYSNRMFFKSPGLKSSRSRKYDIWTGFGSDGYLYDFVK